jgi:hypothetical protein
MQRRLKFDALCIEGTENNQMHLNIPVGGA